MIYYETELYHHGVKGQKWGVRRYQNKDGSLTKAGQKKLDKINKKYERYSQYDKQKLSSAQKNLNADNTDLADLKKNGYNSKSYKSLYGNNDRQKQFLDHLIDSVKESREINQYDIKEAKQALSRIENRRISELSKYGLIKIKME